MTPAAFLADRLSELDRDALKSLASVADVELKTARRAAAGEPIKAADALKLYAARGYDPVTFEQIPRKAIGSFNHQTLALFLNGHMRVARLRVHKVAAAMQVSTRVLQAMLEANPVNINNVVKACRYLGFSPFACCDQPVKQAA